MHNRVEAQYGKAVVDKIGDIPFTYFPGNNIVIYESADPNIMMSYNQLRYLSLFIANMCQYYPTRKIVKIGKCQIIDEPKDEKCIKINKIKFRL